MLVPEFLEKVNYSLRGTDDDAPAVGTAEADYWLSTFNAKKNELYRDVSKNWSSAYDVRSLGAITAAAAPAYPIIDDAEDATVDFLGPSDQVYVITTDDRRVDFDLIKPNARSPYRQQVFIAGLNPETLYFTCEIDATEAIVGGELFLPGYWMPPDVSGDEDIIPVLDPYWGVAATASEIAFADITYEDRAEALNSKANALYAMMVAANRKGTYKNPRITPTVTKVIRDTRRR